MIGYLSGKLLYIKPPQILIDVSGVGYEVDLPIPDCTNLPLINQSVVLYTHLIIRDDAHLLYGFLTIESRDYFRTLIKISGVGPKIALALLSTLSLSELTFALSQGDVGMLCRTPGIGKKVAERMILELKGKLSVINNFIPTLSDKNNGNIRLDIANALVSLGYNDKEINRIMHQLSPDICDLSLGIKEALRILNK